MSSDRPPHELQEELAAARARIAELEAVQDVTERRRAEETLRRYELLARHSRDILLFMNRDDGRILEANEAAVQAYGYSREELLELTIHDLRAAETQELTARQMAVAHTQGILFESVHRRKDGSTFPVEVSSQGATIGESRTLISVIRNITRRRQAEQALRESEERLRLFVEHAPASLAMLDRQMRYVSVSRRWLADYGLEGRDLRGQSHYEVFPEIPDRWREIHRRGLGGEVVRAEEDPFQRTDGSVQWLRWEVRPWQDAAGQVGGIVVFTEDVTARKQAQDALRESEQRVRRTLQSVLSPEGDLGVLELADLIDVPALQKLMDNFHAVARIPMAVLDVKGRVLVGVGWQDICTRFHRVHPDTCRHCLESDTQLSAGLAPGECRLYKCKNNLWDMATPIHLAGQHVGNIYTGQFFFVGETVDRESFLAQARQYGFDEVEYLAALDGVPRLSRETVDRGMAFFLGLADMLSQLGYSNVNLARLLAERARLTDSLRQSEERLSRAQEIAHLGSWELDLVHDRLSWSDEVYRIFGLRPQEFGATYEAFLEHVHPDDRGAVDAAYSGSLRERRDRYEIEHRVVRRDTGEIRVVHEKCEHFRDGDGKIVRSVGMVHDITDRKRREQDLRQAAENLRELSENLRRSNQDLEQFAYVASHDLQEPLRMVAGYLQLIERRYKDKLDQDAHEFIGFAVDGATRMSRLITDLLEYSRIHTRGRPPESVAMEAVLDRTLKNLQVSIVEAGAAITHDPLPTICGDGPQLVQLFQNLLGNAIKFRDAERPCRIHVSAKKKDGEWIFCVEDNGIGLDPQYAERIFLIFQRLHSRKQYPGTGIGLAICKRIVERHGGRIWVESDVGQGARFFFAVAVQPQAGAADVPVNP